MKFLSDRHSSTKDEYLSTYIHVQDGGLEFTNTCMYHFRNISDLSYLITQYPPCNADAPAGFAVCTQNISSTYVGSSFSENVLESALKFNTLPNALEEH